MQNPSYRMKRLLASDLLPQRAGQPVKALVHISFADLLALDPDSTLQDKWASEYQARWAAHRAAASVTTGDGGAWLEGDAARKIAYDAMIIPVVTGDIDPGAVEDLITLCVEYDRLRAHVHDAADAPGDTGAGESTDAASRTDTQDCAGTHDATNALADLEHQILAKIRLVLSGPGGAASFLRRHPLGKPLGGPSLPLDVGQTDEIPVHLRRLVALRDQTCQFPGGCDQPAASCEAHHVIHRKDGGHTSLTNLKDYCSLVAPPRRAAPARLDPDRPPRRHQHRPKPRWQDHPQPPPSTSPRVNHRTCPSRD
jgi:hypothetical protein